jgi:hypothetical protein
MEKRLRERRRGCVRRLTVGQERLLKELSHEMDWAYDDDHKIDLNT